MQQLFQVEFRASLGRVFAEKVGRNPRYSKRSFASSLQVSSAALSEILRGKRNVSVKYAETLMQRAKISETESQRILQLAKAAEPVAVEAAQQRVTLDMDQFHMISDWYYFAILSLAELEDFNGEESEIARRLGIDERTARDAVDRLLRLSLLARGEDGKLRATNQSYTTTDQIPNEWIKRSHAQSLHQALASIERHDLSEADFISMTAALDPVLIPSLKVLIRDFVNRTSSVVEHSAKRRVYRLCVQLFPLSDP